MHQETLTRSITKTISWRCIATLSTGLLVWIFTGDITAALTVGGLEAVIKMVLYYLHERTWNGIPWGRQLVNTSEASRLTKNLTLKRG